MYLPSLITPIFWFTSRAHAREDMNWLAIGNVRAVLSDMNCKDEDVVQMVAYCKKIEVEKIFNASKGALNSH